MRARIFWDAIIVVLAAFILFSVSLFNGFPILFFDVIYYLYFAMAQLGPSPILYRPVSYSYLIAATHSLFLLAFLQGFWLVLLLWEVARVLGLPKRPFLGVLLAAFLLTPIALCSNCILPDIFFPIQVLSLFLLSTPGNRPRWVNLLLVGSFLFASMTHYSNLILCVILIPFWFAGARVRKAAIALGLLAPLALVSLVQYNAQGSVGVGDAAHVFLFSRFTALGISQTYLEKECKTRKLKICAVLEHGFPIWDNTPNGTIAKMGGMINLTPELRAVNADILTSPPLLARFAALSARNSVTQFFLFSRPLEFSMHNFEVATYMSRLSQFEIVQFYTQRLRDLQPESIDLGLDWLARVYFGVVVLAFFAFLFLCREFTPVQWKFFQFLLLVLVLNAVICGTLTEPLDRYQLRGVFLFPLFVIYFSLARLLRKGRLGEVHGGGGTSGPGEGGPGGSGVASFTSPPTNLKSPPLAR